MVVVMDLHGLADVSPLAPTLTLSIFHPRSMCASNLAQVFSQPWDGLRRPQYLRIAGNHCVANIAQVEECQDYMTSVACHHKMDCGLLTDPSFSSRYSSLMNQFWPIL